MYSDAHRDTQYYDAVSQYRYPIIQQVLVQDRQADERLHEQRDDKDQQRALETKDERQQGQSDEFNEMSVEDGKVNSSLKITSKHIDISDTTQQQSP